MSDFDYSQLNPGIRDLVRELREVHGMETTDSGDGTNYANGMECAMPMRHVAMVVDAGLMVQHSRYLANLYPGARVECSWAVGETAIILLFPDGMYEVP